MNLHYSDLLGGFKGGLINIRFQNCMLEMGTFILYLYYGSILGWSYLSRIVLHKILVNVMQSWPWPLAYEFYPMY